MHFVIRKKDVLSDKCSYVISRNYSHISHPHSLIISSNDNMNVRDCKSIDHLPRTPPMERYEIGIISCTVYSMPLLPPSLVLVN